MSRPFLPWRGAGKESIGRLITDELLCFTIKGEVHIEVFSDHAEIQHLGESTRHTEGGFGFPIPHAGLGERFHVVILGALGVESLLEIIVLVR